ncbi:methionyl-tRNA formyltransferase [Candidatus Jorgensenbacteria bacterium RIFCSPLOWO2_01_FULL_45_25b]|uniref:Methionyl-tRNA formyltransferase n=1 Tax=Candidatus Jorgensenbacteria bacterium RIFCSPLOWO2_01_FULL_45_25b TaxID=1798471 RepID=A0A1F6C028_9BACT|nr:MAG: methionyl-tRNA formyltransferase [Candidatus Jorgensenbacteria bacterium RIFCSPLOWO2_01_FULL_45_25b]
MKYIFFGTPEFASIILEKLIIADMPPALVVTNPDRPAGRNKTLTPPPVKVVAEREGLQVLQPEILNTKNSAFGGALAEFQDGPKKPGLSLEQSITNQIKKSTLVDNYKSRGPAENRTPETQVTIPVSDHPGPTTGLLYQDWDFFLVVAYGKIIPKNVLDIPRLGTLNVHPSLLPRHRGPTPIQTAILNGDEITGVSIILLDEEVDHGPILAQKQLKVESLKLKALERTLANLGVKMLVEILPKFMEGELTPVAQEHAKATFTKKFTTDDAFVSCEHLISALSGDKDKALHIDRMIRALNPEPGVWTRTTDVQILDFPKNKRIKLLESGVREGRLKLRGIQVEGRKPRELLISNG